MRCDLYLPETSGPHPLICITPILGRLSFLEDLYFERKFAKFFTRHGFATALIHRPIFEFDPEKGLEQIQAYLEESLDRNKKTLQEVLQNPDIDGSRLATFGISFGAVVNSLWAAREPRFKAHVFALGGGNLPDIFMESRDPLMRSYFNTALLHQKGDKKALRENLAKIFVCDPVHECKSLNRENILLIFGLFDRVVPLKYGLALKETLGNPKTIFVPLGHYFSILAAPYLTRQALKFFKAKLT